MRKITPAIAAAFASLAALAACERQAGDAPQPAPPPVLAEATVSDELPGLAAAPTGIAFWEHPTLPFNSMMIVASADGVISYNIEDGNEVSRIPGVNTKGAAVSYIGLGQQAAGVMAIFDTDENAFKFFGIANTSRDFLPIEGGPAIRGNVRGYCFGRALDATAPTLFVVQKSELSVFNFEQASSGLVLANEAALPIPENIQSCAVDVDGVVLGASENGEIYRIAASDSFASPFAKADIETAGDFVVVAFSSDGAGDASVTGNILMADKATGALHIFDRADGRAIGAVNIVGTEELEGVNAVGAMGAVSSNLGGLYRNGAVALSVETETSPAIRIVSINGLLNALDMPRSDAISPRGAVPEVEDSELIIDIEFNPE